MPPFKDEHILIIAPGSQTTLAQLGLPESFTPARFRFPTRMFPAEKKGEWEPYRIHKKTITVKKPAPPITTDTTTTIPPSGETPSTTANGVEPKQDVEMKDTAESGEAGETTEQKPSTDEKKIEEPPMVEEEKVVYEEDTTSDEGAIYPMRNGSITDWTCFFALLTHIYNTLSPPFHTPIMLISQPAWTGRERETVTQFIFEKFKAPAFCLMDSALAVCYAYGTANATVVDVGHGKADITAVTDFTVNEHGRGIAVEGCGGEAMTNRLLQLLEPKGFTRDMCEQLKKSSICEILSAGTPLPQSTESQLQKASTGTEPDNPEPAPLPAPGKGPEMASNTGNGEGEEDDGVLDVAAIVTGNTTEFLAQKEKEKAEKAAARKANSGESGASKPIRLPNSKKKTASFQYQEPVRHETKSEGSEEGSQPTVHKREIEVGTERFLAASPSESKSDGQCGYGIFDTLAAQIHHTILSVPEASKRSELWDSLIVLGNGSKIKGFPQALLSTITQKYVLSPSSGTIFTSELPSAFSTPLPTGGTTTPAQSQSAGPLSNPAVHGVNPLLVAATHANNPTTPNHINPHTGTSTSDPNLSAHYRSTGHSQTPTSIKLLKPPEYFPEWKDSSQSGSNAPAAPAPAGANASSGAPLTGVASASNNVGMEEATFLGAQVASKVVFVIDQGLSKGFLGRVEYNEAGPSAIHEYSM